MLCVGVTLGFWSGVLDFFQIEKYKSIHSAKSCRVLFYFYSSQHSVKRQSSCNLSGHQIIQTAQESMTVNLLPLHRNHLPITGYNSDSGYHDISVASGSLDGLCQGLIYRALFHAVFLILGFIYFSASSYCIQSQTNPSGQDGLICYHWKQLVRNPRIRNSRLTHPWPECNLPHGTLDLDRVSIRYPGRAEIVWAELETKTIWT